MKATGIDLLQLRLIMYAIVAIGLALFVWVERRAKSPILPPHFFANKNFVLLITTGTLFGAAFMGSILYLTQFNQQVFGASPTVSGLMLLPMIAGILVSSITSGQIISRLGKYKIFMQVGFSVATVAMFLLSTLTPSSPYLHEALIMLGAGLGMGVAMPTLNLAMQNEFSMRELGAATSSNQLFRSLGSTIGTAVFGAMLTAGIIAHIGHVQQTPYIQTISKSPEVAKIGSVNDTNTILSLNMPNSKHMITDAAHSAFAKLPEPIASQQTKQFDKNQQQFTHEVTSAFSKSLQNIFYVAGATMVLATVSVFLIKERPLKSADPEETPGEA
jgi:hypothetical protein